MVPAINNDLHSAIQGLPADVRKVPFSRDCEHNFAHDRKAKPVGMVRRFLVRVH